MAAIGATSTFDCDQPKVRFSIAASVKRQL